MSESPVGAPEHDVYTVMVILSTLLMAAATIFLMIRSHQWFGSWNPFS